MEKENISKRWSDHRRGWLFEDGSVAQGQEPVSGGALDGELVGGTDNFAQDHSRNTDLTNLDNGEF
jgi:hypothetical protein